MPSNIEIKAWARGDPQHLRDRAAGLTTQIPSVIRQEDTFYRTPRGRLKLRVPASGPAELIYYERASESGPRRSAYSVAPVADPSAMKRVLEESLGVRGVVRKTRELFIAVDTRIHLDEVESLGRFLEIEVVLSGSDDGVGVAAGHARCRELMRTLGVQEADLLCDAYIDMLESRHA
jgi:adenylate cyclase class IV